MMTLGAPHKLIRELAVPVLLVVVSAGLFSFPLFRDFDYEYHQTLSLVIFLTSALWSIHVGRRSTTDSSCALFMQAIAPLAVSLGIILMLGLTWVVLSDGFFLRSLLWFILLPVPSLMVGTGLGLLISSFSGRYSYGMFLAVCALTTVINLWHLYGSVPIFVYSIFWGYFAGPLYDELLPITTTLILHRLVTVIWALLMFSIACLVRPNRQSRRVTALIGAGCTIMITTAYLLRESVGMDIGYAFLEDRLSGSLETPHVILKFDPELDSRSMELLSARAEFAIRLSSDFLALRQEPKMRIYVYRDEKEKKTLMGAGSTNFAKVWRDEIHLNADDGPQVLHHELTHVLAREFGHPLFSTHRIGFLEGLAVAADWSEPYFTPHQWAAALKRMKQLPDVRNLIEGSSFFTSGTRMGYVVSGSFVRYLVERHGAEKFKQVYFHGDIQEEYRRSLEDLVKEWQAFLDTVDVKDRDVELADVLLQPGLFGRAYVHGTAEMMELAGEAMNRGDFQGAIRRYDRVLQTDPSHVRASFLKARAQLAVGQWDKAIPQLDSVRQAAGVNFLSRASLDLLHADALVTSGRLDAGMAEYRRIENHYASIRSVYVAARIRRDLGRHPDGPRKLASLLALRSAEESIGWITAVSDSAANPSLRLWAGKIYQEHADHRSAWAVLDVPLDDDVMEYDRLVRRGVSALYLGHTADARKNFRDATSKTDRINEQLDCEREIAFISWVEEHY